ncbi:MAG: hypothetical protein ACI815_001299 [Psychroserpens sp.]|jgi:hypothetical protein
MDQSLNRSIQLSDGSPCIFIPNPCPPLEYICISVGTPFFSQGVQSSTLAGANPKGSSVAKTKKIGGLLAGTISIQGYAGTIKLGLLSFVAL